MKYWGHGPRVDLVAYSFDALRHYCRGIQVAYRKLFELLTQKELEAFGREMEELA